MDKLITDIPLWWLIIWALISIAFSVWFYQNKKWLKEVSAFLRFTLFSLRLAGIFLIGVLLFGILFQSNEYKVEKPILINVVDASMSMTNYKDSTTVLPAIKAYSKTIQEKYGKNFEVVNYLFDNSIVANYDSLNFDQQETNLSSVFQNIQEKYYQRNIGAITVFSDGNFNKGGSPVYSAKKIPLTPIFSIGVGDTIIKTDQIVQNVLANNIAFLGNQFPIEVDIEANKIGLKTVQVALKKDSKVIAQKNITYTNENFEIQHIQFLVEAKTVGYNSYSVEVQALDNEFNFENNKKTVYVEVLDARSKVLLTSSGPHPDLGVIKNVLSKDVNLEIEAKLLEDITEKVDQYDLIVLHQPSGVKNKAIIEKLVRSNKPILFFISSNTDNATIQSLPIGLTSQNMSQIDNVQAKLNENFNSFEVSRELQKALDYFPPVQTKYGKMGVSNNANIFLYQRLGSVVKKDPLFYFLEQQGRKVGVFYGEGIWRWKLAEYAKTKKNIAFQELITKAAQFLVVRNDASNLRVNLPSQFTTSSNVQINAEFYNDNLELITTPEIKLELKNENKVITQFDFAPQTNQYSLQLGKLKAGNYTWKAKANFNGKSYSKSGNFVVKKIEVESLDTRADHNLLYQLASNSNGAFYTLDNVNDVYKQLETRTDIAPVKYETEKYLDLIDYKWIFVVLVLLFGLEWFLRRYNGGY